MSDSLRPHGLYSPWNSPGQNAGVGSCSLLQGIFPTPGIEPRSPALQGDSLPAEPQGKLTCEGNTLFLLHVIDFFKFNMLHFRFNIISSFNSFKWGILSTASSGLGIITAAWFKSIFIITGALYPLSCYTSIPAADSHEPASCLCARPSPRPAAPSGARRTLLCPAPPEAKTSDNTTAFRATGPTAHRDFVLEMLTFTRGLRSGVEPAQPSPT